MRRHCLHGVFIVLVALGAALAIEVKDPAPGLTIAPLNRDQKPYDIGEKYDGNFLVCFVNPMAQDREAMEAMVKAVDPICVALSKWDIGGAIAVVGPKTLESQIKAHTAELKSPICVVDPLGAELKAWELPQQYAAITVLVKDGIVFGVYDSADKLREALTTPDKEE